MSNMTIQGLANSGVVSEIGKATSEKSASAGFGEVLKEALDSVNQQKAEADELVTGLVRGEHANIHETMIAMEKSGITFRLATKVQGKVLEAYKEVMRMQI